MGFGHKEYEGFLEKLRRIDRLSNRARLNDSIKNLFGITEIDGNDSVNDLIEKVKEWFKKNFRDSRADSSKKIERWIREVYKIGEKVYNAQFLGIMNKRDEEGNICYIRWMETEEEDICGMSKDYRKEVGWTTLYNGLAVTLMTVVFGYVVMNDYDNDGVLNYEDNCIEVYNPSQIDIDGDGGGDVCDGDIDGDGVANGEDYNKFLKILSYDCDKEVVSHTLRDVGGKKIREPKEIRDVMLGVCKCPYNKFDQIKGVCRDDAGEKICPKKGNGIEYEYMDFIRKIRFYNPIQSIDTCGKVRWVKAISGSEGTKFYTNNIEWGYEPSCLNCDETCSYKHLMGSADGDRYYPTNWSHDGAVYLSEVKKRIMNVYFDYYEPMMDRPMELRGDFAELRVAINRRWDGTYDEKNKKYSGFIYVPEKGVHDRGGKEVGYTRR